MKVELQTTIDSYVNLLEKIKERVDNNADSLAILAEIRQDQRMELMREKKVINGNLPATENQIGYLKRLGAEIPEGLTRLEASEMIDKRKEEIELKKALEAPVRVP